MVPLSESGEGGGHWFLFLEICMNLRFEILKVILFCEVHRRRDGEVEQDVVSVQDEIAVR